MTASCLLLPVPMVPCLVVDPDSITCHLRSPGSKGGYCLWIQMMMVAPSSINPILWRRSSCRILKPSSCCRRYREISSAPCPTARLQMLLDACFWYYEWIKHEYDVGSQRYDAQGLLWKKIVITHLTPCQGKFYFSATMVNHGILEFNPHPTIRIVPMHGVPQVVPPNPWGFTAHGCRFETDGEPHQFFVFYYGDPAVATNDIGDRALL